MLKKKQKEKNGTFQTSEVVFLLIITCVISIFMGVICSNGSFKLQTEEIKVNNESLNKIIQNYQYIIENYYEDVDQEELAKGAINGMINALGDDYSNVIGEDALDNFNKQLEGSFVGIGIEITNNEENNVYLVSVFKDSPADRAGMQAGDIIVSVEDTSFLGKPMTEVTKFIQALNKNKLKMTYRRDGIDQTVELTKEKIIIPSVSGKMMEQEGKKIGYIAVDTFSNTTYSQFKKTLETLEGEGMQGLVIDVRGNSGGHLTAAENILSLFLNKNHVIYQTQTKKETKRVYSTGREDKTYPVVILQNFKSASASELLASAFQEAYGSVVVGTNSYGKGTIQELVNFSSDSEYKFTTKKWLTPKGNWVNGKGVQPDVAVDLNEEYQNNPSEETDNQLQTALSEVTKEIK